MCVLFTALCRYIVLFVYLVANVFVTASHNKQIYMNINVWHSIEQRTVMHPLTSGIRESKHGIFAKGGHFKHVA